MKSETGIRYNAAACHGIEDEVSFTGEIKEGVGY
jgi:hypothetical protein